MSDDRVLEGVEALVRQSNEITAELLAYLIEVEERGSTSGRRALTPLAEGVGLEVRAPERARSGPRPARGRSGW